MKYAFHKEYLTLLMRSFLILFFSMIVFAFSRDSMLAAPSVAELQVKSSPDAQYSTVQKMPCSVLDGAVSQASYSYPASDLYIQVYCNAEDRVYNIDQTGNLHSGNGVMLVVSPAARSKLLNDARLLRSKHYGEMVSWEEANTLMPRKAILTIIDLETGLRFNAQRRAGSQHADVQPLTKSDTIIMSNVYNGKWSWQRRAILIEVNGRTLAASMNGMPHGGDGIPDNGFSGHFCIHFNKSRTHGKGNVDLGHQLMAAKASGLLESYINGLDPFDVINTFFIANESGDRGLMHAVFLDSSYHQAQMRHFGVEEGAIRYRFADPEKSINLGLAVDVTVETCRISGGQCANKSLNVFHLRKWTPHDSWKIDELITYRLEGD